jgi:hypothetical protein
MHPGHAEGVEQEERETRIVEIGRRQHGVVSRRQLLELGVGASAIGRRCASGRLRVVHDGIYAFGPQPLSERGRIIAALLAIGPDPLLSHHSSAARQDLLAAPSVVHVSISTRVHRRLVGVVVHRPRRIDPEDRIRVDGLPMTSVPRTVLDLAEFLPAHRLATVVDAADRNGVFDFVAIEGAMRRYRGHRGVKRLRGIIGSYVSTPRANEGIERKFQLLLHEFGLPIPELNVLVEGLIVDCWWPNARFVVELDSREWHRTWRAHERDRKSDAALLRAGIRSLRITHHRIRHEPQEVARDIAAGLRIDVGHPHTAMRA